MNIIIDKSIDVIAIILILAVLYFENKDNMDNTEDVKYYEITEVNVNKLIKVVLDQHKEEIELVIKTDYKGANYSYDKDDFGIHVNYYNETKYISLGKIKDRADEIKKEN